VALLCAHLLSTHAATRFRAPPFRRVWQAIALLTTYCAPGLLSGWWRTPRATPFALACCRCDAAARFLASRPSGNFWRARMGGRAGRYLWVTVSYVTLARSRCLSRGAGALRQLCRARNERARATATCLQDGRSGPLSTSFSRLSSFDMNAARRPSPRTRCHYLTPCPSATRALHLRVTTVPLSSASRLPHALVTSRDRCHTRRAARFCPPCTSSLHLDWGWRPPSLLALRCHTRMLAGLFHLSSERALAPYSPHPFSPYSAIPPLSSIAHGCGDSWCLPRYLHT